MISGKTQIAAAAAVLALSASVSAAPSSDSYLEARGAGFSKVAKVGGDAAMDIAHRKAVAAANGKINDHFGLNKPHVPQGLADAAKAHSKALSNHGKKKRDLEEALDELFARSGVVNRVTGKIAEAGLDIAHRKAVGAANDKINHHIGGKPHVPQGLADAAKAHNKALANHGASLLKGKKKRDLEDALEELLSREFEDELDELIARGAGMSKMVNHAGNRAFDIAHPYAVNAANNKIHDHFGLNKPHVPQGLADAAKAHNKALANHGAALLKGKKKRDLEDEFDELVARGAGMSKVAKHGTDVAFDVAHRHAVNHANSKINEHLGLNKPHVPQGLVDAAKAHQKALSSHGKKKRDLEDAIEELIARGAGMSKVAKHGTDVAFDVAHRHAVNHANSKINEHFGLNKPHVPQGLADAAKAHQKALSGHGKKKRDLEDEFDELVARGAGMSKVAKHGTDVAFDIAHRHAVDAATHKINDHFGLNKPHVPAGLAEAARKHTQPHDPKLVAAAIGHSRRKRDLDALIEYLEARDFELDDLE